MSDSSNNTSQAPPKDLHNTLSSAANNGLSDSNLPSQAEHRRSRISKRFTSVMDHLQSNIFVASQRLNDLTGYSGIESLRRTIEAQEALVQQTRSAVRTAKEAYSTAIKQRSASQREVNELLQRKHAWTPQDLERFTALYRSDHANEQAEIRAAEELAVAERAAEEAAAKLSRSILARYHEEQIWSDKIRRMSTWGTWGLMGVNVLLFVIFQVGVEPWRRKRLVSGFEEKVKEAIEREMRSGVSLMAGAVNDHETHDQRILHSEPLAESEPAPEPPSSTSPLTTINPLSSLKPLSPSPNSDLPLMENYKSRLKDLFSTKPITLKKRDLTTIALESAAAGAVTGATLCAVFIWGFRRG